MSANRLPSAYAREMDSLLRDLGYDLRRSDKHLIYAHPSQEAVTIAATPKRNGRARKNTIALLKARHPEYFADRAQNASSKENRQRSRAAAARREKREAGRYLRLAGALRESQPEPPQAVPAPDRTSCLDCGRPWLSDLPFIGRPCPQCGGTIVAGRAAA